MNDVKFEIFGVDTYEYKAEIVVNCNGFVTAFVSPQFTAKEADSSIHKFVDVVYNILYLINKNDICIMNNFKRYFYKSNNIYYEDNVSHDNIIYVDKENIIGIKRFIYSDNYVRVHKNKLESAFKNKIIELYYPDDFPIEFETKDFDIVIGNFGKYIARDMYTKKLGRLSFMIGYATPQNILTKFLKNFDVLKNVDYFEASNEYDFMKYI